MREISCFGVKLWERERERLWIEKEYKIKTLCDNSITIMCLKTYAKFQSKIDENLKILDKNLNWNLADNSLFSILLRFHSSSFLGIFFLLLSLVSKTNSLRACLITVFVFYFCFLAFKGKRIFFFFSKWKTHLVNCFEKHIFQKQNSGNLFGSCFWKSWILFSLVNLLKKLYLF